MPSLNSPLWPWLPTPYRSSTDSMFGIPSNVSFFLLLLVSRGASSKKSTLA